MERSLSEHSIKRDSREYRHPRAGGDLVMKQKRDSRFRGNDLKVKVLASSILLIIFFLFSFFLMFHTFGYDGKERNILISRKVWSDFGAHIPLIRSFSMGDNFDLLLAGKPEYPLYPGEPIRYHFLFYAFVGLLERAGLPLDWALNLPSAIGFFLLLLGIFQLSYHVFHSYRVSVLSVLFFLFNGSLAFMQFFLQQPVSASSITDILHASEFPAFAPWGPGDITAFWNLNIYTNQRHLSLAFALGIWFLVWVASASHHSVTPAHAGVQRIMKPFLHWIPAFAGMTFPSVLWGIVIGLLPSFHQPMLLVFAILLIWYFLVFPRLRLSLTITGLTATLLILPQLTSSFLPFARHPGLDPGSSINKDWIPAGVYPVFRYGAGMTNETLRSLWYPGYLIHDRLTLQTFLSFWFANLGLHAILVPMGFLLLPARAKKVLIPLFLIFIMGNLFKFSPEVAANHKFFNFTLMLGTIISAYTVIHLLKQFSNIAIKQLRTPLKIIAGVALIGILTLSGIIDFFVVFNDQKGAVADVGNSAVATWIAQNSPNSAVFLNSNFLYHPASLAGRKIFLGWPYFAWSAGYQGNRHETMKTIYESKDPLVFCPLLTKHRIDYVTVEDTGGDPNLPNIEVTYFLKNFSPAFINENKTYAIFTTQSLCTP